MSLTQFHVDDGQHPWTGYGFLPEMELNRSKRS